MFLNNILHNVPDFVPHPVYHLLGALDVMGHFPFHQFLHDKGFKELQSHFFRQTALVHLQFRPHNDYRAARVVNPFTQEVLAETALLTLEHIAQRLEGAIARSGDRPAAAAVID